MTSRITAAALAVVTACLLAGCSEAEPAATPQSPSASALDAPVPGVTLPPHELLPLVPEPDEVPAGMVPLVAGSGPRDAAAIADFSADPAAAARALADHGFRSAYVAQYAHPSDGRVLSAVVVRFADAAGAQADLTGDLSGATGEVVEVPTLGEQSQVRRQPLPGDTDGQLVTVRFRQGSTTWLLAYGAAPEADPAVPVELARALVDRAVA